MIVVLTALSGSCQGQSDRESRHVQIRMTEAKIKEEHLDMIDDTAEMEKRNKIAQTQVLDLRNSTKNA